MRDKDDVAVLISHMESMLFTDRGNRLESSTRAGMLAMLNGMKPLVDKPEGEVRKAVESVEFVAGTGRIRDGLRWILGGPNATLDLVVAAERELRLCVRLKRPVAEIIWRAVSSRWHQNQVKCR